MLYVFYVCPGTRELKASLSHQKYARTHVQQWNFLKLAQFSASPRRREIQKGRSERNRGDLTALTRSLACLKTATRLEKRERKTSLFQLFGSNWGQCIAGPFPPTDNIGAVMMVWSITGNTMRTVLSCATTIVGNWRRLVSSLPVASGCVYRPMPITGFQNHAVGVRKGVVHKLYNAIVTFDHRPYIV